ncbi:MAG: TIGR02757 family protein [Deltaproteobacteria bacterium]|nr:TIGR02757 family protein [Deltaproteobacteria bacterium]MBW2047823.1 TIGR02757 family protein [Deltaproteobacteria bacterium]HDZ90239.1 TIGR02757 family protein [Deltaproteobacteria bacterium]
MTGHAIKHYLDNLYHRYNGRQWVHPDPLEYLYDYPDINDREVTGVVASSLAYGRVGQILKSVATVLQELGPSPAAFLESSSERSLIRAFQGFKHRFSTGREMALLLIGVRDLVREYGSLGSCFREMCNEDDETVLPWLSLFVDRLTRPFKGRGNSLIPLPEKGSACKRLNLFLRWMIREDRVDPGGWRGISPSKLIVPLDTHMHRISRLLNLTRRKNADMRTALEITRALRRIYPEDPIRYDFALTRLGIRKDEDVAGFFARCLISDP